MTEPMSGSYGRRWWRRTIPLGMTMLLAVGATADPAPAATAPAATAPATPSGPTTRLLAPTGDRRAGTVRLHLVDPTRVDPTSPGHGVREIMVQVWYPAIDTHGFPSTPYLPPLAAAHFLASNDVPPTVSLPPTIGHVGAPVDHRHGPYPVVLYSPGGATDGSLDTGLVEDLVSHGFVVVAMDDTNDSPEVEFPGGRLVVRSFEYNTIDDLIEAQQIRADDARFVLDALAVLNRGGNPDAEHAALPSGLAGSLELARVGMFGWSIGGAASAQAMRDDARIKAAANLDGTFWGPLAQRGVDRPFLLLTGSEETEQNDPSLGSFLAASTGPKLHLALADSQHSTFSDFEELVPQLAPVLGLTPEQVAAIVGTIDPKTAVTDERAYLRAFFDKYLRRRDNHLLDGPSPRFPDIQFAP
jgi:predicted dienelactone hydrolase